MYILITFLVKGLSGVHQCAVPSTKIVDTKREVKLLE
jgi:hypothetical protein